MVMLLLLSLRWGINDDGICARKLSNDHSTLLGAPILLFEPFEASWAKTLARRDGTGLADAKVTDGPFLHRNRDGAHGMIFETFGCKRYLTCHSPNRISDEWLLCIPL